MALLVLFLLLSSYLPSLTEQTPNPIDLEQKLSSLESKVRVTDQKYAAVLSNVLSKLTSNSEELVRVKAELNSTLTQLAAKTKELHEVKATLTSLQDKVNNVTKDLEQNQIDWNSSECSCLKSEQLSKRNGSELYLVYSKETNSTQNLTTAFQKQEIGFEVMHTSIIYNGVLRFTKVHYNAGEGYDPKTGYFTAPVSGAYLLWFNVGFTVDKNRIHEVTVTIKITNQRGASFVTPVSDRPGVVQTRTVDGVANGIYAASLQQGDKVSFRISLTRYGNTRSSSFGGVLL